jgi:Na+-driven multidrug efflux pump
VLATIGLGIASLALVGHLYGARRLYAMDAAAGMALPTAIGIASMFLGTLAARPPRGWLKLVMGSDLGAVVVRRLMPWIILRPPPMSNAR